MVRIAIKDYFIYFKKILFIVISYLVGIGIFSALLFLGVYLPIKRIDPDASNAFFKHLYSVLTSINFERLFSSDTMKLLVEGLADILSDLPSSISKQALIVFIIGFALVLLAKEIGELLTRASMRADASNKNSIKGWLAATIRSSISLIFWAVSLVIVYYWFFAVVLIPFVYLFLSSIKDLLLNWIINFRKYKLGAVLNIGNLLRLSGTSVLMQVFNYVVIILILSITNFFVAFIIALPLLSYNSCSMTTTTTNYINEKISERKLSKVKK